MLLPLLERGVAVHHSGMIPVLREVVEILFQATTRWPNILTLPSPAFCSTPRWHSLMTRLVVYFQEGLVRFLFATETFAMGLNMPARTVVFTSLRKWDGEQFRPPSSAEYIQMSGRVPLGPIRARFTHELSASFAAASLWLHFSRGAYPVATFFVQLLRMCTAFCVTTRCLVLLAFLFQAGRRGLDARGMVILLLTEEVAVDDLRSMMHGEPLALSSSFRLRYNTLLRLYAMESLHPEALVRQSFYAFLRAQLVPELQRRRGALLAKASALRQPDDAALHRLLKVLEMQRSLMDQANAIALHPRYAIRFLQPGRVVHVSMQDEPGGSSSTVHPAKSGGTADRGRGVVLGFRHACNRFISEDLVQRAIRDDFIVDILLPCLPRTGALVEAEATMCVTQALT